MVSTTFKSTHAVAETRRIGVDAPYEGVVDRARKPGQWVVEDADPYGFTQTVHGCEAVTPVRGHGSARGPTTHHPP